MIMLKQDTSLKISKLDGPKEFLRILVLEIDNYSTVYLVNDQFQKCTYTVLAEFEGKQITVTYFHITGNNDSENFFLDYDTFSLVNGE